jgi:hypothetical protein
MPHIKGWKINGKLAPSVNEVTDMIPKDWLLRWYRKVGFDAADEKGDAARERGTQIHRVFEDYLKGLRTYVAPSCQPFLDGFNKWVTATGFKTQPGWVEPHLESAVHHYHGSPDIVGEMAGGSLAIVDYKIKLKHPDYKTILNEAAYIELFRERFSADVSQIIILRFNPDTGKMLEPLTYENKPEYFRDFLALRAAYEVKLRADRWDKAAWRQTEAEAKKTDEAPE